MVISNCKQNFASFPCLSSFLDKLAVKKGVLELMKRHISVLGEKIRQYFPDLEDFLSIVVL